LSTVDFDRDVSNSDGLKLGIIGPGKMGGNLALQAHDKNTAVVGKARNKKQELEEKGIKVTYDYNTFAEILGKPKIIYLSLPAGKTVDTVLDELLLYMDDGDVIMDGGNSFYMDSIEREKRLSEKNIYFLDCGTSGGIEEARYGACFMVGGKIEGYKIAYPILRKLALNDKACIYTGKQGSGHFVKLVHNGIEFGMLQSIGEGVSLLVENNDFGLDLKSIFRNWSNGSVIRGWLVELMERGLKEQEDKGISIQSYVEDTGEENWLVMDAINKEIPIPVISQSIMELFQSRVRDNPTYKSIALMRHGFGGHPFGKDEHIAEERRASRIAKI
jgi:6-phosphogluconate dehydrogenase